MVTSVRPFGVSKVSMNLQSKFDLTLSVVLYNPDRDLLRTLLDSVKRCQLKYRLYILDNSATDAARAAIEEDDHIIYHHTKENLGFGKAHNIAMRHAVDESRFHVVLNPDVYFESGTLESLFRYMELNSNVGLLMPKVLNTMNEVQYLCKKLPSPFELFLRRFVPVSSDFIRKKLDAYEMKDMDYDTEFEAPYLSGCFMFLRTKALREVGFFDERYFMYMEDVDLSRRIFSKYKNVYFPKVQIYHVHARESYKTFKLLKVHMLSAIQYFNKWGWIFDTERERLNQTQVGPLTLPNISFDKASV